MVCSGEGQQDGWLGGWCDSEGGVTSVAPFMKSLNK